jgi:putative ABC transport system permease protein
LTIIANQSGTLLHAIVKKHSMVKLFFRIAWRNLLRNKTYSFINIIGLATGLCCFIMISMYVADELSYDRFNKNGDRIYRIHTQIRMGGSELKLAVASDPMGATLKKDYPQVEEYVRFYNSGSKLIKKGNEYINENKVIHADSTLFNVFTLPAVYGDTKSALDLPNTVVVTQSGAKKLFGTDNVVGRYIETNENNSTLYKITAVIKDMPRNSHFNYDYVFSMGNVNYNFGNYLSQNFHTYLLLKKGTDYKQFEKVFPEYIDRYVIPQAKQVMQIQSMSEFKKAGNALDYMLMPLYDIHLHSSFDPELGVNGNIQYVYIFSAVAIFILLLACINFVNLATARSIKRAREVGVRKVLGTTQLNLIKQFLAESAFTVILSMIIAIIVAWQLIPVFNQLAAKQMTSSLLFNRNMILLIVLLPLVVSIVAGSYPAFFLSSFNPSNALKGKVSNGVQKSSLRSGLVVFQFATSIILIVATITVYQQLHYIQNTKIGFNKDQVLVVYGTGVLNNPETFKNEIKKLPGVISGTFGGYLPVSASGRSDMTFSKEAVLSSSSSFNMQTWGVDYDYINTLGMQIIRGRNFSPAFGTDSNAIIINETTASLIGASDPVGKVLYAPFSQQSNEVRAYKIIGVVKNFNYESLREHIGPLCFMLEKSSWATAFRIQPGKAQALVSEIERKWKSRTTGMPFNYRFLDDAFNNMYEAEQRVGRIAIVFAILAVIIACLGLFGLATYIAEQRTKEIGVRKVLGATVNNIIIMLSRDFLKLVIIASLIAFPIAWWAMHKWLQDYTFRITLGWWIFVVSGLLALIIAIFTISFQAVRAALSNPVKSLRTE